ncbi:MAG: hypothetical protein K8U57_04010 [Planctomycetes bacterium]|nr:hypothetical protein [Planctomycetota bacterium]
MATVTGNVTFDGKPIPDGDITFSDPENKVAPDGGKIKNGVYTMSVRPGKKKVDIRASKLEKLPAGQKGAMGETEMPVDYIPGKYNQKSELTADVATGANKFDFTLTP